MSPSPGLIKEELARVLVETLRERGLTQTDAAGILGAAQPDVSDLTRGKLERFSVERLMRYAGTLGLEVRLEVGGGGREGPSGEAPGTRDAAGSGLPEHLHRYFWDRDPTSLDLEADRETIVGRLLEAGGLDAVAWLRGTIGDPAIGAFLERRQGRGLGPRRLRFWALVLGLPRGQVDRWVEAARENPWERRASVEAWVLEVTP